MQKVEENKQKESDELPNLAIAERLISGTTGSFPNLNQQDQMFLEQQTSDSLKNVVQKCRIGILGGSFNPPTIGHMQMAAEVINLGHVDQVWIVPCGDRKDKKVIEGQKRLEMVNILVQDFFKDSKFPITVKDIEINKTGMILAEYADRLIPTYKLMQIFISQYPDCQFFFIMGSDLVPTLPKWESAAKLIEEINFLIFRRVGYQIIKQELPKNYIIINTTFVASSSTEVRKRINKNLQILNEKQKRKQNFQEYTYDPMENTSFPPNSKFTQQIATIKGENLIQKRKYSSNMINFEEKYLGVYGIVPLCIIQYIKEQNLYADYI